MASNPNTPALPPLMDSPDVKEIYASEVIGTGRMGNSVAISLATHRWVVPELGADLQLARVVVARLVLSSEAALQLARRIASLAQQQPQAAPGKTVTGSIASRASPPRVARRVAVAAQQPVAGGQSAAAGPVRDDDARKAATDARGPARSRSGASRPRGGKTGAARGKRGGRAGKTR